MKQFIRYNSDGKILSLIKSNDKTLNIEGLVEIDEITLEKVEKDIKKYKVKNKKVIVVKMLK